MKALSVLLAVVVAAIPIQALAEASASHRKSPPPIKADLAPPSYLMVEGNPPRKVIIEDWIIELFTLKNGDTISRKQYLEIEAYRAKVLLR